jgi:membrane associated rhomboid family serine protease
MVMLPLYDLDPLEGKTTPYVNYGIIAACVAVSIVVLTASAPHYELLLANLSVIPAAETRALPYGGWLPVDLTLLTSVFLHRDWSHLAGNMIFLWVFGDNVEDALGHVRYLIFYILCGIAGALAFVAASPDGTALLMGASGAIAGVMAAYMMLRPCARIEVLFGIWPYGVPAWIVIGVWIALQLFQMNANDGVAYFAHIGGAAMGAALILLMRPRGIELFDCMSTSPPSVPEMPAK